jgi:cell wall-associated NlpC family hydrolase
VADAGPADSGPKPSDSTGTLGSGSLKASDFGYNDPKYQSVFDIVQKFCDANQKYELAKGHTWQDGYASVTDCSGFTGSFYQKLAAISGIPPVFPKNSWYQTSTNYKSNYTDCITTQFPPPDPRDLIKPGDVFVMNKGAKYGHVGVFMGYDKSGNPVIAHSTTSTNRQNIYGKQGTTGVRIEVLPRSYQERWAGIYRIKGTDEMLNKLADKS